MLENIKPELINQDHLKTQIEALEGGYVETLINLIKWPEFIKACETDLEKDITEEKKTALQKALDQHKKNQVTNEQAIEQLNVIITEARTYLTK